MKKEIISQYKASIRMLVNTMHKCPENLWDNDKYENRFWRIVYHTLYYTSLYISPDNFSPWIKHKLNYHRLEAVYDNKPVIVDVPYSKQEMIEYAETILDSCETLLNNSDFEKESGFQWLPLNRGELHLYNIRHIQHHTGQLIERLRQNGITGFHWISKG